MTLVFGQVFVRGLKEAEIRRGIVAVWGREGYAPFAADRIPARYPAHAREFSRVAVSDPDVADTRAILIEDWDRTFPRALALTREWPEKEVVAVVRPPLEPTRVKVYRDGGVALKVGEDPDDEVPYCPAPSSDEEVERFVRRWRPESSPGSGILNALGVIRRDCPYHEALAGAWPHALTEWVFIERASRLHRES